MALTFFGKEKPFVARGGIHTIQTTKSSMAAGTTCLPVVRGPFGQQKDAKETKGGTAAAAASCLP